MSTWMILRWRPGEAAWSSSSSVVTSLAGRVFLEAAGDDPQRPVREGDFNAAVLIEKAYKAPTIASVAMVAGLVVSTILERTSIAARSTRHRWPPPRTEES